MSMEAGQRWDNGLEEGSGLLFISHTHLVGIHHITNTQYRTHPVYNTHTHTDTHTHKTQLLLFFSSPLHSSSPFFSVSPTHLRRVQKTRLHRPAKRRPMAELLPVQCVPGVCVGVDVDARQRGGYRACSVRLAHALWGKKSVKTCDGAPCGE